MDNRESKKLNYNWSDCRMKPEKYRAARLYGESTFNMIVLPTMYIANNAFVELTTRVTKPENKKFKTQKRKVYVRDANDIFERIMTDCIESRRDESTRNYLYRYNDLVDEKFHGRITSLFYAVYKKMTEDGVRDAEIYAWTIVISGLLKYSCHVCECITAELAEIFKSNVFEDFRRSYSLAEVERLIGLFIDDVSQWCKNIRDYELDKLPETKDIIEEIDLEIRRETILENSQQDATTELSDETLREGQSKAEETMNIIGEDLAAHREKYKNLL